jgi:hypothetical protein
MHAARKDLGNVPGLGPSMRKRRPQCSGPCNRSFAERLGLREGDPLIPSRLTNRSVEQVAAIHARRLGCPPSRRARGGLHPGRDLSCSAWLCAARRRFADIERRVDQLLRQGHLEKGKGADRDMLTTRDAISLEQRIIAGVEAGRGVAPAIVSLSLPGPAAGPVPEQIWPDLERGAGGAGRLLLGSNNRIVAIQGVAGAGKSTVLKPVADILREEGKAVLGLAVQNTLVQMLERDTGYSLDDGGAVPRTASRPPQGADAGAASPRRARTCAAPSWCSTRHRWSAMPTRKSWCVWPTCSRLDRFASIGDTSSWAQSMPAKPFDVMQQAGIETRHEHQSSRAREGLRKAQQAAQGGRIERGLRHLGDQRDRGGE